MKKQAVLCAAFVLSFFWAYDIFAADTYSGKSDQGQPTGTSSDTAIIFYGKVIDQYGQPVAKAKITVGLNKLK